MSDWSNFIFRVLNISVLPTIQHICLYKLRVDLLDSTRNKIFERGQILHSCFAAFINRVCLVLYCAFVNTYYAIIEKHNKSAFYAITTKKNYIPTSVVRFFNVQSNLFSLLNNE